MFHSEEQLKEINIMHALRFADLLSKSTYEPVADKHKLWGAGNWNITFPSLS